MEESIVNILSKFIKDKEVISMFVNMKTMSEWKKGFTHESVNYIKNYV